MNFVKKIHLATFFLVFLSSFFIFLDSTSAARSVSVSSTKNTLFGYETMILTASSSGFTNGETIYIKGAFYQDGTTNYFGYTNKNDTWIKNGETTVDQKSIKIGEWDGTIEVKSDFSDSGYKGEGGYKLKLGFYYLTTSGNLSSINWSSNSLDVNINDPDPTITPTPTPSPQPTATSTPKPTNIPTSSPSPMTTTTLAPTISDEDEEENVTAEGTLEKDLVLTGNTIAPSPMKQIKGASDNKLYLSFFFIGSGIFCCGILGFYILQKRIHL